jgi:NAD(P)-dependent dehydrogenase (short-subunit alcohol dehydrogenase family)
VNAISPGPVETPIIDSQFSSKEEADKLRQHFQQAIPVGRMGRPEELAAAALFLASDESSFVAGIDLPVDGGMAQI